MILILSRTLFVCRCITNGQRVSTRHLQREEAAVEPRQIPVLVIHLRRHMKRVYESSHKLHTTDNSKT